jgi:X-Pro dipeptidyl-peptidase
VLGDMRGTHNSDGCFDFGGPGDQEDGYAVVEWIADQAWSNGNVGMYGVSHPGMSQYAAAVKNPPHLKAIIPIAPITSFYRYLYNNGAHYETNMATPPAYEYAVSGPPPTNINDPNWLTNVVGTACNTHNVLRGMSLDGDYTPYWRARDYSRMASNINAAVYAVHGTLDENVKTDHFTSIWDALNANDVPRKALIGPWPHAEPAVPWWHLKALRWYEHWLNGNDTGVMTEPRVETIDNQGVSRFASDWAPTGSLTLQAGARELAPSVQSGTGTYKDVPHMPRQLLRAAEGTRLLYTTAALTDPLRLLGAPVFDVLASIDAADTNFVVHLYDIAPNGEAKYITSPNGEAKYITRGYLDARHRDGLEKGVDVPVGAGEQYRVELHARDYVFAEGHRIQVLLASSDSCHWAVEFTGLDEVPQCHASGIVSDATAATVSVYEGTAATALKLPLGVI